MKTAFTLLIIAGGSYIVLCWILYRHQERLIFYPEVLPAEYTYTFDLPFGEVFLPVDGATLNALHFRRPQPEGVVLYLHGNAGSLRSWGDVAQDFVRHGYDLFILDYRGYGKSTGSIHNETLLHDDVAQAYGYLQARYDEAEIIIYGRSLGTGLATNLARHNQPQMLILETPYLSMKELALAQLPFIPKALLKYPLPTDQWIVDITCPIYLIHGTADAVIPYSHSTRLVDLMQTKAQLITISDGQHNNLREFEAYQTALMRILETDKPR